MIRIVASGDQHIDARHMTTLEQQRTALSALIEAAVNADVLALLGDATHTARPSPAALELWGEQLRRLDGFDVRVIALAGNHEGPAVARIFEHFRGSIEVVTEPRIVTIRRGDDVVDFACLPWLPMEHVRAAAAGGSSKEDVAHELTRAAVEILRGLAAQRREGVPLVLLTHATIAGAETSTGFNLGYLPTTSYVLPIEELAPFDLVLAGHIHRHAALSEKIAYTGSLLPLDFSESERKGYIRADVGPRATNWSFMGVPTPTIETWEITGRDEMVDMLESFIPSPLSALPDALRLRVHCEEATAREIPPARWTEALHARGVRLVQTEYDVARADRRRDAGMTADLDVARAMDRYLEERQAIGDVERLTAAARQILTEVQQRERGGAGDLVLTRLEATDFLGLERAELDVPAGIATITGPVGIGKSSLGCDVLRWSLFGESRLGARGTERLVRQGADRAVAAVELRAADGREWRIVRTASVDGRGRASTTLDVLQQDPELFTAWRPLTDGKIASGTDAIARILGGLTDRTVIAANLIVQRASDTLTAAAREDRRRILAEAAGLEIYDALSVASTERKNLAERASERLEGQATALRARANAVPPIQAELAETERGRGATDARIRALDEQHINATAELERERARVIEYDRIESEATMLKAEADRLDGEIAEWGRKRTAAETILHERAKLVAARAALVEVRERIVELEQQWARGADQNAARALALAEIGRLGHQAQLLARGRAHEARRLDSEIARAREQEQRLEEAACCAPEPSCVLLDAARGTVAEIPELERGLAVASEASAEEGRLARQAAAIEVPAAVDSTITQSALDLAREKARELERMTAVAEKIAKAEQILAEHADATSKLAAAVGIARASLAKKNALLLGFGGYPQAAAVRARERLDGIAEQLTSERATFREHDQRVSALSARLDLFRESATEVAAVAKQIRERAIEAADQAELVKAWRAVRVTVLENEVIPAVEQTANEVLRRFPYGLQIALVTQRDRKSGEGQAEALDLEVLGGLAPVYELCSGGQRTAIDVSLHVAIALVVSRRASTRLTWMFIDEPEGLDEQGRLAFAGLVRWIHEELGIGILVASHHADLVDAIGGERIELEGEPGRARLGARELVAA